MGKYSNNNLDTLRLSAIRIKKIVLSFWNYKRDDNKNKSQQHKYICFHLVLKTIRCLKSGVRVNFYFKLE